MPWPTKKQSQPIEPVQPSFPTGREDEHHIEYDLYGRVIKIDNVRVPIRQEHAINPMPPEIVILPTDNLNKATSGMPPKRKYKPRKKPSIQELKKQRHQWRWGMPETSRMVEQYTGAGSIDVHAFDVKSAARMIAGKMAESIFGRVSYFRQCRVTPRQPKDKTIAQFRVILGEGLGAKIKGVQRDYEMSVVFRVKHIPETMHETTPKIPEYMRR